MNSPAFATPQATPLTSRTVFSGLTVPRCEAVAPRVYIVPEMTRFAPRMHAAPSEEAGDNTTEIPTTESMTGIDDGPVDISSVATATMEPEEEEDGEYEPCAPPQPFINAQNVLAARQKFKRHETDSGSPEFQIATLTTRIAYLTDHLKTNPKDFSSTRGLLKMVATRRRLLKFLKREDEQRFTDIIAGLNIRVSQQIREL